VQRTHHPALRHLSVSPFLSHSSIFILRNLVERKREEVCGQAKTYKCGQAWKNVAKLVMRRQKDQQGMGGGGEREREKKKNRGATNEKQKAIRKKKLNEGDVNTCKPDIGVIDSRGIEG